MCCHRVSSQLWAVNFDTSTCQPTKISDSWRLGSVSSVLFFNTKGYNPLWANNYAHTHTYEQIDTFFQSVPSLEPSPAWRGQTSKRGWRLCRWPRARSSLIQGRSLWSQTWQTLTVSFRPVHDRTSQRLHRGRVLLHFTHLYCFPKTTTWWQAGETTNLSSFCPQTDCLEIKQKNNGGYSP